MPENRQKFVIFMFEVQGLDTLTEFDEKLWLTVSESKLFRETTNGQETD